VIPLLTCPELALKLVHKGKVREMFELPGERLLLVATDRLSAFDVVFGQGIPGKGRVLTGLSVLWFEATRSIAPNHLLSTDVGPLGLGPTVTEQLKGRSMIVKRTKRIDVECVVRGYLAGSGWKEYQESRSVCGVPLPEGLKLNSRLPEPIFTPALKNDTGHDENVSEARVRSEYGDALTEHLKQTSLALYRFAAERADQVGIILADTKFEFGQIDDQVILIDEIFTPDSSRYWPADRYREGDPIDSLDKQPIRDYVEQIGWDKRPPAPDLPDALILEAAGRYEDALTRLSTVLKS